MSLRMESCKEGVPVLSTNDRLLEDGFALTADSEPLKWSQGFAFGSSLYETINTIAKMTWVVDTLCEQRNDIFGGFEQHSSLLSVQTSGNLW